MVIHRYYIFMILIVLCMLVLVIPRTQCKLREWFVNMTKTHKAAILLYGQPRGLQTLAFLEKLRQENPKWQFDIFFHAWTDDQETREKMIQLFKPVQYKFEAPRHFDPTPYQLSCERHSHIPEIPKNLSQAYSREQAANLVKPFERYYHLAISTRFDFKQSHDMPIDLFTFKNGYIHISEHGYANFNDNIIVGHPSLVIPLNQAYSSMNSLWSCDSFRFADTNWNPFTPEGILIMRAHQMGLMNHIMYHRSLQWVRP